MKEGYVEYDLDNEDEDWWAAYNSNGNVKLSAEKFEKMLFRLEVACSEANMRPAAEPGGQGANTALNTLHKHGHLGFSEYRRHR